MKYERLTDKDWHKEKFYGHSESERTVLKRLWDLENKIEQGTLIELPCKVGDTVYQTDGVRIYELWVLSVTVNRNSLYFTTQCIDFDNTAIGKSIFLTREEAEKRLKELQELVK